MNGQDLTALSDLIETSYKAAQQQEELKKTETSEEVRESTEQERLKKQVEQTLGAHFEAPVYDIFYKQQVSPEEVYGGFEEMTPSCIDSQFLVIRIKLPGEQFSNLDLNVTKSTLTLFGKIYRLHLELPHDVLEKTARATFKQEVLEITVKRADVAD